MKTNKKLLSFVLAVLMILSILPLAGLTAFAETSDDEKAEQYLNGLMDMLPDEFSLDFPESEYEKAEAEIERQVKEIWQGNGVDLDGLDFGAGLEHFPDDREEFLKGSVYAGVTLYFDYNGTTLDYYKSDSKAVSLKYSNSDDYDQANEQEIEEFISELKFINIENYNRDKLEDFIGEYCNRLADVYSLDLVYLGGVSGGYHTGFRGEEGVGFEIFKNDVFYGSLEILLPILHTITVPSSVSDKDLKDVLPKYAGWDWDITVTNIEKNALIDDCSIYYHSYSRPIVINIPNAYTMYFTETDNGEVYEGKDYILIEWEADTKVPNGDNATTDKAPDNNSETDKTTTEANATNTPSTNKPSANTTTQNTENKNGNAKSPSTGAENGLFAFAAIALTCTAVSVIKKKED